MARAGAPVFFWGGARVFPTPDPAGSELGGSWFAWQRGALREPSCKVKAASDQGGGSKGENPGFSGIYPAVVSGRLVTWVRQDIAFLVFSIVELVKYRHQAAPRPLSEPAFKVAPPS